MQRCLCGSQPISNQCCGGTSPRGSYYGCKIALRNDRQETEKIEVYYLHDLKIIQHTWGHTVRSQGGRGS